MHQKNLLRLFLILSTALTMLTLMTKTLPAVELTVDKNSPTSATNFHTIQGAITAADTATGDYVLVKPDTYTEQLTLRSNVSLYGEETGRTIISGGGSSTAIRADGVSSVSVINFTIIGSPIGIDIFNDASVSISGNVFRTGSGGTAVRVQNTTNLLSSIINNTFYNNNIAVTSNSNLNIQNNIFSNNTTAIDSTDTSSTYIRYNCFYANSQNGKTGEDATNVTSDPKFANTNAGLEDFHLQEGSPCIDAGNTSIGGTDRFDASTNDIGAYGGTNSDTKPFPITILTATGTTAASPTITITWARNKSYLVTHTTAPGGYKVFYDSDLSEEPYDGNDATEGTSPIDVGTAGAGNDATYSLSNLSPPASPALTKPTLTSSPLNTALDLSWTPISGATGYKINYGIIVSTENEIDVGNITSYKLTGLTNGQVYKITVTPYAQAVYYIAIKAYDSTASAYESDYSVEAAVPAGPQNSGPTSDEITDFPEEIVPYPNLPNEGCFIATAAYGYYSAPQVQTLRNFRDQHLLTNAPGRIFVKWYYTYGPIAAQFINEHPWLKPAVRVGLLPAVGVATFMARTTGAVRMAVVLFTVLILFFIIQRKFYSKLSEDEATKAEQQ